MKSSISSAQKIVRYLQKMREIRASAAPELSYYPALQELFEEIGGDLKPKVHIVHQPRISGEGAPDFGFYTDAQIKRGKKGGANAPSENPDRGVAEVKKLADDIGELLRSEQVKKYARACGIVLATNFREFALAEMRGGKVVEITRWTIAASEEEFWQKAAHPQTTAAECAEAVCEFLRRALSQNAPITRAEDVAQMLASFAREAMAVLEQNKDKTALQSLRTALESALSMKFEDEDGAHFFHSTLSQTIFYGLFSAWMEMPDGEKLNWRAAAYSVKTPVMRALFAEITNPDKLRGLGLEESLDGATAALNRVKKNKSLFGGIGAAGAIQHFYEPFLAAFDPQLRANMGVWYTPPEIVQYMVERADRVLRTELKIADGLADENVYVLDPCGGTGAYIAEVLRRIHKTCEERGDGDGAAQTVKTAAQTRIIGFEILSASYVIAHWQIGALLSHFGAPLAAHERAAIYLTNSLTNWTPAAQPHLDIPGLEEERDAANEIKQNKKILVILGNPPYNAFAGTSPAEEAGLVEPYKKDLIGKWGIRKFNLDDLYVRFFRMAQNRIAKTGRGIVSFISNYSYTAAPSFVVMRESLLESFDKVWVENMHGDRNKSERAPDGRSSNTVFAMRGFSPGIRQGIVVSLFCKTSDSESAAKVLYRNDIDAADAEERRAQLLASLVDDADFDSRYEVANPNEFNKLSFRPIKASVDFQQWASLDSLCNFHSDGLMEKRGGALIDIDRDMLEKRMRDYFNSDIDWETYQRVGGGLAKDAAGFDAQKTRVKVLTIEFNSDNIMPYTMRPFDNGFCYYSSTRPIWNRLRPDLWKQFKSGNSFLVSRSKNAIANEGAPAMFTGNIGDNAALGLARYIPFYFYAKPLTFKGKSLRSVTVGGNKIMARDIKSLTINTNTKKANLSKLARDYLQQLNFANPDKDPETAEILWLHALAVCYAPAYQRENADGLNIGWPRIPLPQNANALKQSAALGAKIRALLDMKTPLDWRTPAGKQLTALAKLSGDTKDLSAADWWGYKDGKGKVYPGKGKISEMTQQSEYASLAAKLGAPWAVHLNDSVCWNCVPSRAWEYRIGGFQPPKKWLSYRAKKILNRPLRPEEIRIFADIIRRISALILLEEELDRGYLEVGKVGE